MHPYNANISKEAKLSCRNKHTTRLGSSILKEFFRLIKSSEMVEILVSRLLGTFGLDKLKVLELQILRNIAHPARKKILQC